MSPRLFLIDTFKPPQNRASDGCCFWNWSSGSGWRKKSLSRSRVSNSGIFSSTKPILISYINTTLSSFLSNLETDHAHDDARSLRNSNLEFLEACVPSFQGCLRKTLFTIQPGVGCAVLKVHCTRSTLLWLRLFSETHLSQLKNIGTETYTHRQIFKNYTRLARPLLLPKKKTQSKRQ